MEKKIIAIIAGGDSSEHDVSMRSAAGIYSWIDQSKFEPYIVEITSQSWEAHVAEGKTSPVNRHDFSFEKDGKKIIPDYAYITIHGTPGEDGILQGYFDLLHIPYSTSDVLVESMTFNKFTLNQYLKGFGVKIAESLLIREGQDFTAEQIVEAFSEWPEVIIEAELKGTEISNGVYKTKNGGGCVLPITEVVSKNEFFDYDAKYNGAVEEITPARLSDDTTRRVQALSSHIYDILGASGIIRMDYIISHKQDAEGKTVDVINLLEINTTPGMTPTSFIPQQVAAAGMQMTDVLNEVIADKIG